MNGTLQRCLDWLFPLQRKAEEKSVQAIAELDQLVAEIQQQRVKAAKRFTEEVGS